MKRYVLPRAFALALAAISLACPSPAAAAADDASQISATAAKFVDAINKGRVAALAATFAPVGSVLDEIPPHHWSGPHAIVDWYSSFKSSLLSDGDTEPLLTTTASKRLAIDGNYAYDPLPALYQYKHKGRAAEERGILILALQKIAGTWKITSMAWTQV